MVTEPVVSEKSVGLCVCVCVCMWCVKELGNLHIDMLYNKYRQMHSIIKPIFYINTTRHSKIFQPLKCHIQGVKLINCSNKIKNESPDINLNLMISVYRELCTVTAICCCCTQYTVFYIYRICRFLPAVK